MRVFSLFLFIFISTLSHGQKGKTLIDKYGAVELYFNETADLGNYATLRFRNERFPNQVDYASITLGDKEKIERCINALRKSIDNAPNKIAFRFDIGNSDYIITYDDSKKIYLQTDRKHTTKEPYITINTKNATKLIQGLESILKMI